MVTAEGPFHRNGRHIQQLESHPHTLKHMATAGMGAASAKEGFALDMLGRSTPSIHICSHVAFLGPSGLRVPGKWRPHSAILPTSSVSSR